MPEERGETKKKVRQPPAPTENAMELLVQDLLEVQQDARGELVNVIKAAVMDPGGTNVVWGVLCRTRKKMGPNAGLLVLLDMLKPVALDDEGTNLDRSSIEPALQLLAFLCNFREYAKTIAKLKGVFTLLVGVLKDWECTHATRVSCSWVLRRCTE